MRAIGQNALFRWLVALLVGLAVIWAAWLLWGAWPALRSSIPQMRPGWLLLTLFGNAIGAYLGFEAFRCLFLRVRPQVYRRRFLGHLYFTGQLMKHLPGRIWGIAYQSAKGPGASIGEWVSVTTAYMALSAGIALWVAGIVLGFARGVPWGVLALFFGLIMYFGCWSPTPLGILVELIHKLPAKVFQRFAAALSSFAAAPLAFKISVLAWFCLSWLVYLISWAGFGLAWPGLSAIDGMVLCAMYTLAWFVGYVTLLSPSGLGVRELVFALVAHRYPPDVVAGVAIVGRVILLAVDILLGLAFAGTGRSGGPQKRVHTT